MQVRLNTYYRGFELEGTVVIGDTEGDASIPRGTHELPPYIVDLTVLSDGEDVYEMLTDKAIADCETALLETME